MVLITMLRRFKVPLKVLDAFLTDNGIPEEHEALCMGALPSFRDDSEKITALLRYIARDTKTRLFVPFRVRFNYASNAYIAYDWILVFAQGNVKRDKLLESPPAIFENLRQEILSYGTTECYDGGCQIGLWIVVTDRKNHVPSKLSQRQKACINVAFDKATIR